MIKTHKNTIYQDPIRYDDENWWKKNDLEMWKHLCHKSCGNNVLELASGTGRISIPLLREGFQVTGIELSEAFATRAGEKVKELGFKAEFHTANIMNYSLERSFDTIIIGYNSFLHLLENHQAESCLASTFKHMHADSRLYIDIYMPSPLHYYRPENIRFDVLEYFDSQLEKEVFIQETNDYDPESEINHLTWYYSTENEKDIMVNTFTTRMYWPDTMNRMLIEAGFEILNIWGDYNYSPFSEKSSLQIFELKKKA